MGLEKGIFKRTELLLGDEVMDRIANVKVIIFGVGGVGSWCAESLVRSGVSKLTLVDSDRICVTNVNRQLMATTKTVGQVKVEALKERLLDINPRAEIRALQQIYSEETADSFELDTYDYIVDAIDSLENKVHLIRTATRTPARFVSSMGAALKMDPTKINVAEFWKVKGCPLAAALRRRLKKGKSRPKSSCACTARNCSKTKEATVPAEQQPASVRRQKTVPVIRSWSITNGAAKRHASTERWLTPPPFLVSHWPASSWKIFMLPSADPFWSAYSREWS